MLQHLHRCGVRRLPKCQTLVAGRQHAAGAASPRLTAVPSVATVVQHAPMTVWRPSDRRGVHTRCAAPVAPTAPPACWEGEQVGDGEEAADPKLAPRWAYQRFLGILGAKTPRISEVQKLFSQMKEKGAEPSTGLFNRLITEAKSLPFALAAFDELMRKDKDGMPLYPMAVPDKLVFTSLINACAKQTPSECDKAVEVFQNMVAQNEDGSFVHPHALPDAVTFSRLFLGLSTRLGGTTQADVNLTERLFKSMRDVGPDGKFLYPEAVPDTVCLNAALGVMARRRKGAAVDSALRLFRHAVELDEDGRSRYPAVQPDQYSFHTLISSISRTYQGADVEAAAELFRLMISTNADGSPRFPEARPDTYTFNTLLSACAKASSGADVSRASDVFREMMRCDAEGNRLYPRAQPDVVTYNTLLDVCGKNLSGGDVKTALRVFRRMKADKVAPDSVTFNALIQVCCRAAGGADAETAMAAFEEMRRVRSDGKPAYPHLQPTTQTFNYLLQACLRSRTGTNSKTAYFLLDEMRRQEGGQPVYRNAEPNSVTWCSVLNACTLDSPPNADKALELLKEMQDSNAQLTARALNNVISACARTSPVKAAEGKEVMKLLLSLPEALPNEYTLGAVLQLLSRESPPDLETAREWYLTLTSMGARVTKPVQVQLVTMFGEDEGMALAKSGGQTAAEVMRSRRKTGTSANRGGRRGR